MSYSKPPAWVINPSALSNIFAHDLHLPSEAVQYLNVPDSAQFLQGAKQYLFWRSDLAPTLSDNTIILAFLGPQGLSHLDVLNVTKALKSICNMTLLTEVFQGAHTSFLGLSFSDKTEVNKIKKYFSYFNDSIVLHIVHTSDVANHFRLLWLPPLFKQERVHHLLSSLTSSYELRRENIKTDDNVYTPSNIVRGTLVPKIGKTVKDLPHLIRLPTPHKGSALLVISGRDPICLKCRDIGHLRRDCPVRKCTACNMVHLSSSPCGKSFYSTVASRNLSHCMDNDWLSYLGDVNEQDPSPSSHDYSHTELSGVSSSIISHQLSPIDPPLPATLPKPLLDNVPLVSFKPSHVMTDLPVECGSTRVVSTSVDVASEITLCPSSLSGLDRSSEPFVSGSAIGLSSSQTLEKSLGGVSSVQSSGHSSLVGTLGLLPSPPVTRSRSSVSQRKSSHPSVTQSIRSETVEYEPHSSHPGAHGSFIVQHCEPLVHTEASDDCSMISGHSSDSEALSDVSVYLDPRSPTSDAALGRKRKISSRIGSDSDDSLIFKSKSGIVPSSTPPDLSQEDAHLVGVFDLPPATVLAIKNVCPKQTFSSANIRKLKLLHSHGIPLAQVVDSPQLFNLSVSTISKRLKILSAHQTSYLSISDIFQSQDALDLLAGNRPPPTYKITPVADPFGLSST